MSDGEITAAEVLDLERRTFTADQRKSAASKGSAMPDGSFPIQNEQDLKNAIRLAGNAKDPAAAKAHIKKRAKALGLSKLIPDTWRSEDDEEPSREGVRAVFEDNAVEFRDATEERDGRLGTLSGYFAVFNRWTKIDSAQEGRFMEQMAPGSLRKTITEGVSRMRVLFNHGHDNMIGSKPLGPITTLEERDMGGFYEVPLIDTMYNRELLPGLEANLYGASFRFRVIQDDLVRRAPTSEWNPDALPQRTIREVAVKEFGPVTFPAYAEATAGIRSMTDEFTLTRLSAEEGRHLIRAVQYLEQIQAASDTAGYTDEENARTDEGRPSTPPASGRRGDSTDGRWWPTGTRPQRRIPPSWRESTN